MICLNPCGNHIIGIVKLIKQIDLSIKNRSFGVLIILFLIFYIVRSTKRVIIIKKSQWTEHYFLNLFTNDFTTTIISQLYCE